MAKSKKKKKKTSNKKKSTRKGSQNSNTYPRKTQVLETLDWIANVEGSSSYHHFYDKGELKDKVLLKEFGKRIIKTCFGFDENEFIFSELGNAKSPSYIPQSEEYFPWSLYIVDTDVKDFRAHFDQNGQQYLLSDIAGKKKYVVVCSPKRLEVFDILQSKEEYEIDLLALYEELNETGRQLRKSGAFNNWCSLLNDLGPDSAIDKKKQRRTDVLKYDGPQDNIPSLEYVKRVGHMPDFQHPIGWDNRNFRETFKTKSMPFLTTEVCDWDGKVADTHNRLVWGDNLSVLRCLPDECLDLIYIDPPYFSGRDYNFVFGDDDEIKTFSDIWDGGLPTYLMWLNARLWEMKRVLKATGSIYVHLDWHAVHYVKAEMDKIFGYENFRNELIWYYTNGGGRAKNWLNRKHDTILFYTKTDEYTFKGKEEGVPRNQDVGSFGGYFKTDPDGRKYQEVRSNGKVYKYYCDETKNPDDVWEMGIIPQRDKTERIGYETQKPERLLDRIIRISSNAGDTVADFFSGGGTTIATAEKLGRKWIGCDISRIAVSVARDRMSKLYDGEVSGIELVNKSPRNGFTVENHGAYERDLVKKLTAQEYEEFILGCYQADKADNKQYDMIHGFKDRKAVHVANSKLKASARLVDEFYEELAHHKVNQGIILAWGFSKEATDRMKELRHGVNGPNIQLIQMELVDIDSHQFKGDNIRFYNRPAAYFNVKELDDLTVKFDASLSQGRNDVAIHYYQWDFNFTGRFKPSTKPNFKNDSDGNGNPLDDYRVINHKFDEPGTYRVALRIFDKSGAEDTIWVDVEVGQIKKKAKA